MEPPKDLLQKDHAHHFLLKPAENLELQYVAFL